MHHHATPADLQTMMPGLLHEDGGVVDRAPLAVGKAPGIRRPAEQFERRPSAYSGGDVLGGAEQAADDLDAD
jgi:hypothetical protein